MARTSTSPPTLRLDASQRATYIETARDIAKQDGVRTYVNRDPNGNWYVSTQRRNAVYVVHTDGHVESAR